MKRLVAALALLLAPSAALAHHGGVTLAFGPGSPMETNSPLTLPDGGLVAGLRVEEIAWKKYRTDSSGAPIDNASHHTFMNANLSYGFSPALTGTFIVPYYIKRQEEAGTNRGLSDVKLQLTYGFHHDPGAGFSRNTDKDSALSMDAQQGRTWLAVSGMMSLPTGDHNMKRSGETVPDTGMQPGFGAPCYTLSLAGARAIGPVTVNGELSADVFTSREDSSGDTMLYGSEIRANLAGVYELYGADRFLSKLDGILELNFLRLGHDKVNGERDPGSGGDILYLTPGLRFSFPSLQNANLGLAVKLPVWTDLNAPDADAQGSEGVERYRVISTLSFYF
jgi:hypothetical protein